MIDVEKIEEIKLSGLSSFAPLCSVNTRFSMETMVEGGKVVIVTDLETSAIFGLDAGDKESCGIPDLDVAYSRRQSNA